VESIGELTGLESNTPLIQEIFVFRRSGRQGRQVLGAFAATGIVPRIAQNLREQGHDVPLGIFQKPGAARQVDNGTR
jgi:pilus assembly protein CpaF